MDQNLDAIFVNQLHRDATNYVNLDEFKLTAQCTRYGGGLMRITVAPHNASGFPLFSEERGLTVADLDAQPGLELALEREFGFGPLLLADWLCQPCAAGKHESHDGRLRGGKGPVPWSGEQRDLDLFDCKTQRDRRTQCMCRATWPEKEN